jgi:hypothetical protein
MPEPDQAPEQPEPPVNQWMLTITAEAEVVHPDGTKD